MEKSKYEKPVAQNLDAVQPVQGSCLSGNIEYTVTGSCDNGDAAAPSCEVGSVVLPLVLCESGSSAAGSCWSGSSAG